MSKFNRILINTGAIALIGICPSVYASDSIFTFMTGVEHSSGDYGSDSTVEDIYVPIKLYYSTGSIGYSVTVPYLSVRAPTGTIVTNSQGEIIVGDGPKETQSGVGDVIAAITFYDVFVSQSGNFIVDASVKVKLGTADEEEGLGSGENDYSGQVNAFQYFDEFSLAATIGYKLRGEPADFDLDNVWFGSLGADYRFTSDTKGGVSFYYRQSSYTDSEAAKELSVFVSHRVDRDWRVQVYAVKGLSDSSPDLAGGLMVKYYF